MKPLLQVLLLVGLVSAGAHPALSARAQSGDATFPDFRWRYETTSAIRDALVVSEDRARRRRFRRGRGRRRS